MKPILSYAAFYYLLTNGAPNIILGVVAFFTFVETIHYVFFHVFLVITANEIRETDE